MPRIWSSVSSLAPGISRSMRKVFTSDAPYVGWTGRCSRDGMAGGGPRTSAALPYFPIAVAVSSCRGLSSRRHLADRRLGRRRRRPQRRARARVPARRRADRREGSTGSGCERQGRGGRRAVHGFPTVTEDLGPDREALRGLIRSALWESAERGNAVIVAHAASLALAARSDVLRVLITASPETRARRLAEGQGIGEKDAEQHIARGDANRADYLKRFYGISSELPTHYDIVLSTDRIAVEDAAALILTAARSEPVPA